MKLWVLPFFIGILAIFSGNLAYLVSLNEGLVDACLPYLEGCTSISKTGRHGLASILFKLTILPVMTLLSAYWLISFTSFKQNVLNKKSGSRIMVISGLIGSLFGILYTAFLGSEGDIYQLLRRFGIYFFFLGTYIAQILEVVQLSNYPNTKESKSFQLMRVVVIVIGLIILISTPFYGFLEDDDWLENVLEWNITFLIFFYFILSGVLWRKTTLRMEIKSDTN